jgi:hypothetical protein
MYLAHEKVQDGPAFRRLVHRERLFATGQADAKSEMPRELFVGDERVPSDAAYHALVLRPIRRRT